MTDFVIVKFGDKKAKVPKDKLNDSEFLNSVAVNLNSSEPVAEQPSTLPTTVSNLVNKISPFPSTTNVDIVSKLIEPLQLIRGKVPDAASSIIESNKEKLQKGISDLVTSPQTVSDIGLMTRGEATKESSPILGATAGGLASTAVDLIPSKPEDIIAALIADPALSKLSRVGSAAEQNFFKTAMTRTNPKIPTVLDILYPRVERNILKETPVVSPRMTKTPGYAELTQPVSSGVLNELAGPAATKLPKAIENIKPAESPINTGETKPLVETTPAELEAKQAEFSQSVEKLFKMKPEDMRPEFTKMVTSKFIEYFKENPQEYFIKNKRDAYHMADMLDSGKVTKVDLGMDAVPLTEKEIADKFRLIAKEGGQVLNFIGMVKRTLDPKVQDAFKVFSERNKSLLDKSIDGLRDLNSQFNQLVRASLVAPPMTQATNIAWAGVLNAKRMLYNGLNGMIEAATGVDPAKAFAPVAQDLFSFYRQLSPSKGAQAGRKSFADFLKNEEGISENIYKMYSDIGNQKGNFADNYINFITAHAKLGEFTSRNIVSDAVFHGEVIRSAGLPMKAATEDVIKAYYKLPIQEQLRIAKQMQDEALKVTMARPMITPVAKALSKLVETVPLGPTQMPFIRFMEDATRQSLELHPVGLSRLLTTESKFARATGDWKSQANIVYDALLGTTGIWAGYNFAKSKYKGDKSYEVVDPSNPLKVTYDLRRNPLLAFFTFQGDLIAKAEEYAKMGMSNKDAISRVVSETPLKDWNDALVGGRSGLSPYMNAQTTDELIETFKKTGSYILRGLATPATIPKDIYSTIDPNEQIVRDTSGSILAGAQEKIPGLSQLLEPKYGSAYAGEKSNISIGLKQLGIKQYEKSPFESALDTIGIPRKQYDIKIKDDPKWSNWANEQWGHELEMRLTPIFETNFYKENAKNLESISKDTGLPVEWKNIIKSSIDTAVKEATPLKKAIEEIANTQSLLDEIEAGKINFEDPKATQNFYLKLGKGKTVNDIRKMLGDILTNMSLNRNLGVQNGQ